MSGGEIFLISFFGIYFLGVIATFTTLMILLYRDSKKSEFGELVFSVFSIGVAYFCAVFWPWFLKDVLEARTKRKF